jgi:hypothetical protein
MNSCWSARVPIRVRGMVLADNRLFVCGPPDVMDPADPTGAFEGRKGAILRAYSAGDGKMLFEKELDAPPVLDGLIAAPGGLFLSATDGSILRLAAKR